MKRTSSSLNIWNSIPSRAQSQTDVLFKNERRELGELFSIFPQICEIGRSGFNITEETNNQPTNWLAGWLIYLSMCESLLKPNRLVYFQPASSKKASWKDVLLGVHCLTETEYIFHTFFPPLNFGISRACIFVYLSRYLDDQASYTQIWLRSHCHRANKLSGCVVGKQVSKIPPPLVAWLSGCHSDVVVESLSSMLPTSAGYI